MKVTPGMLTFGVEIETTIPREALDREGWSIGGHHAGHPIPNFTGWKAEHDSSIRARAPYTGVEVVSPILMGAYGLHSVRQMVAKLHDMGAAVNRTTGFHVHVGWQGDAKQLRRLICLVAQHEKALYASTGTPNREHNTFCRSIKEVYKQFEAMRDMNEMQMIAYQSRYHALNLQNVMRPRKTVEFRVFAGTLNITKIIAYISLALGLVERAMNGRDIPEWDHVKSERQVKDAKQGLKEGSFAMVRLMYALQWRNWKDRQPLGIISDPQLPSRDILRKMMLKMARKYDQANGYTGGYSVGRLPRGV